MHSGLVSVIIPVYNTAAYLTECVESVRGQTYPHLQIILVDDGSTDESPALCDAFAAQDARVLVIHQENGGLSRARNAGLVKATGKWVLFLDSDDYWGSSDAIERLLWFSDSHPCDVVCFNYCRVREDTARMKPLCAQKCETLDVSAFVENNSYISSACSKLVLRELLEKTALTFQPGVLSEDVLWSLKLLLCAESIGFLPDVVYCYRIRQFSTTRTVSPKHVGDLIRAVDACGHAADTVEDPSRRDSARAYTAFQYCTLLVNLHLARPKPAVEAYRQVYAMRGLLQNQNHRIARLVQLCAHILGVRITSWLLYGYFQIQTRMFHR